MPRLHAQRTTLRDARALTSTTVRPSPRPSQRFAGRRAAGRARAGASVGVHPAAASGRGCGRAVQNGLGTGKEGKNLCHRRARRRTLSSLRSDNTSWQRTTRLAWAHCRRPPAANAAVMPPCTSPPIRCTGSDPYCTLLATGASACHMTRPDGCDEEDARIYPERCEFMACLPADWPAAAA